ncbi:unnamed protein product, partial [Ascophyllum nodosum]
GLLGRLRDDFLRRACGRCRSPSERSIVPSWRRVLLGGCRRLLRLRGRGGSCRRLLLQEKLFEMVQPRAASRQEHGALLQGTTRGGDSRSLHSGPCSLPPKPAAASNTEGKSKEGSPGTPEADRTPTGANGGAEPSTNNHKKTKKRQEEKRRVGRMRTGSTASGGSGRRSRWGRWSQGGCRRFSPPQRRRSVEARRSRGRHREGVGAPGLGQALLRGDRPWRGEAPQYCVGTAGVL